MDSQKVNFVKLIALLTPIVILPFALADEALTVGEDYYGNDIEAAIHEANQNERKVDYANRYWYNRTTEKSFALPKLPSSDLEATSLEGALGTTAAGNSVADQSNQKSDLAPPTEISENNRNVNEATPPSSLQQAPVTIEKSQFTPIIYHEFSQGTMSVQGTVASGTITSTPRP